MLIGGLIGLVIVVAVIVAVVVRGRSRDDEHSVEHYHRQLHTLEEMQSHPSEHETGNGSATAYPASAFRVSRSSTVRLTEEGRPVVPPVPPPPVPNPGRPITFGDDEDPGEKAAEEEEDSPGKVPGTEDVPGSEKVVGTFMSGSEDRAMHGINHRPRRLAGPAAAVAVVLVLIAVLIVTGIHTSSPPHKGKSANTATTQNQTTHHPRSTVRQPGTTTTSTTAAPAVSTPQAATAHGATYQVAGSSYSLALSANGGQCWVEATNPANGSVLFTATLASGQSHTISATGPVTVIAGAPGAFVATVNGVAVALPPGDQAPFTLQFQVATTPA